MFVSDIHYLFARKDRLAVQDNLRAIFPQLSNKEICRIRLTMYRNFAKYLVDFFRFQKLDLAFIQKNIKIKNIDRLNQALNLGKGVIVLTAHLGNWELGGVVVALLGYPLSAVALPHKSKQVNDFFNAQRQGKGLTVIPLGKAVRQCLDVFKKNQIVALVGDRDFTAKGIQVNFFGKPTILPEGPAAFCLKTGAAIIPAFMVRNVDDTFTLLFEEPITFTPTDNRHDDIRALVERYKPLFERYIRTYPDQWYMYRRFWIEH